MGISNSKTNMSSRFAFALNNEEYGSFHFTSKEIHEEYINFKSIYNQDTESEGDKIAMKLFSLSHVTCCCTNQMRFNQIKDHLRHCGYTIMPCSFAKYGCEVKSINIDYHERTTFHFEIIDNLCEKLTQSLTERNVEILHLRKKMEDINELNTINSAKNVMRKNIKDQGIEIARLHFEMSQKDIEIEVLREANRVHEENALTENEEMVQNALDEEYYARDNDSDDSFYDISDQAFNS